MIKVKKFDELTINELYDILELRAEIFVVEQECAYNDVDGKDKKAIHMWKEENGKITGYIRVIPKGVSYDNASIGRVVTAAEGRGKGVAKELMLKGIEYVSKVWEGERITIGAQEYLKGFYGSLGFKPVSDVYLEDGIPHLDMTLII